MNRGKRQRENVYKACRYLKEGAKRRFKNKKDVREAKEY